MLQFSQRSTKNIQIELQIIGSNAQCKSNIVVNQKLKRLGFALEAMAFSSVVSPNSIIITTITTNNN